MSKNTCVIGLFVLMLLLLALPGVTHADAVVGDLMVSGDTHYTYDSLLRILTITGDGTYRIGLATGVTAASDTIVIAPSVNATVTISDLAITAPNGKSPIWVTAGASLSLISLETNRLVPSPYTGGSDFAAIRVPIGASIEISGTGELTAGSRNGAGIGGNSGESAGEISIHSGKTVASSTNGAGIGGGRNGSAGRIVIDGGEVETMSALYGAGIGGGENGACGTIRISNAIITATAFRGAAIGTGFNGNNGAITIDSGTITASGE